MASTIKLTTKRQATFPAEVCERLGIGPGDELELIPRVDEDGERFWILQKREPKKRPWSGRLRRFAANADDHSMESVRESIRRGKAPS